MVRACAFLEPSSQALDSFLQALQENFSFTPVTAEGEDYRKSCSAPKPGVA
jgi:hypothetical protein